AVSSIENEGAVTRGYGTPYPPAFTNDIDPIADYFQIAGREEAALCSGALERCLQRRLQLRGIRQAALREPRLPAAAPAEWRQRRAQQRPAVDLQPLRTCEDQLNLFRAQAQQRQAAVSGDRLRQRAQLVEAAVRVAAPHHPHG